MSQGLCRIVYGYENLPGTPYRIKLLLIDLETFFFKSWQGLNYIFGGIKKKNQISQVDGCRLRRIGSLSFDLIAGGCANANDEEVYLCFGWYETKKCRKAEDPLGRINEVQSANYEHKFTRMSASSGEFIR